MDKKIWIVNDILTGIPGTKTFWHLLLEIEGTIDKTGTSFNKLAESIENDHSTCSLIIRNATYFRHINKKVKQIAFLQDSRKEDFEQLNVCNRADCVVFNTEFTKSCYKDYLGDFKRHCVIPIGVNTDIFKPQMTILEIFSNDNPTGIFVGDYNVTKGTKIFHKICERLVDINFIYISRRGNMINLPNVKNYIGGKDELTMSELYNIADFAVMCSPLETLHLTTVEAALCNKPVIGTNTGWLADYFNPSLGIKVSNPLSVSEYIEAIKYVCDNYDVFSPREQILKTPFVWDNCKNSWENLISEFV